MLPLSGLPAATVARDSVLEANPLSHVRAMGRTDDPQALKEVAKQFEAIFIQQMLKSMRAANAVFVEDSYFNSNEMQFHQELLDQQMSLELSSGRGLGLADALYAQLQRAYGQDAQASGQAPAIESLPEPVKHRHVSAEWNALAAVLGNGDAIAQNPFAGGVSHPVPNPFARSTNAAQSATAAGHKNAVAESPESFAALLRPYAEQAAGQLQIDPDVLLAQAALETGWGRHVIHTREGENTFNLFNIKADHRWQGERVNVMTLEYRQGVAQQERADFRRYTSYAESFADYVHFMQNNPRYRQALASGDDAHRYAQELQNAGYATDPNYARKIQHILAGDRLAAGSVQTDGPGSDSPSAADEINGG